VSYRPGTGKHFDCVPFDQQGHQLLARWLVDDYAWSAQVGGAAKHCPTAYEPLDANAFEVEFGLPDLQPEIRWVRRWMT